MVPACAKATGDDEYLYERCRKLPEGGNLAGVAPTDLDQDRFSTVGGEAPPQPN
jgi:hypothetical protein